MKTEPYSAILAQRLTEQRERNRNKPKLKNYENIDLREFVVTKLKDDWSPEQIAGVLKEQPPKELNGKTICLETIYQYIYNGDGRFVRLFKLLRRGRNKRQKRWSRKANKISISERISIHQKPEEVDYKKVLGHWESDTLKGKKLTKANLSVQYERKYQLAGINKVQDKSAKETENAIKKVLIGLPLPLWKSITFDNGKEGVNHVKIKQDYFIDTYFCDSYKAWQKGGVENLKWINKTIYS
jgi:IS30 family transposase